jgi:hypothetical protein
MTERELLEMLRNNPDLQVDGWPVNNNAQIDGTKVVPVRAMAKITEHDLQAAVIARCDQRSLERVEYGLIFAIPNGQYRQGQRMEPGLRPGIPDLFLPVARQGYHGLFIELKVGSNKPTESQNIWLKHLEAEGYRCVVIWDSVDDVIAEIERYLEM